MVPASAERRPLVLARFVIHHSQCKNREVDLSVQRLPVFFGNDATAGRDSHAGIRYLAKSASSRYVA